MEKTPVIIKPDGIQKKLIIPEVHIALEKEKLKIEIKKEGGITNYSWDKIE